jgi:hypothetical protein
MQRKSRFQGREIPGGQGAVRTPAVPEPLHMRAPTGVRVTCYVALPFSRTEEGRCLRRGQVPSSSRALARWMLERWVGNAPIEAVTSPAVETFPSSSLEAGVGSQTGPPIA